MQSSKEVLTIVWLTKNQPQLKLTSGDSHRTDELIMIANSLVFEARFAFAKTVAVNLFNIFLAVSVLFNASEMTSKCSKDPS